MTSLKFLLLRLYRTVFLRRAFYQWHKGLFLLGLSGLGILNYDEKRSRPEERFITGLFQGRKNATVLDIGAHTGGYASLIKSALPTSEVYAFEPHPQTFQHLAANAERHGFHAYNLAHGDQEGTLPLYDYRQDKSGSEHASFFRDVISEIHKGEPVAWEVAVTTVDAFLKQHNISTVDLLKIDTEGNEMQVLRGARNTISSNSIDVVQFEFNEMNIVSRVFFKDFYEILPNYQFFRMLPDGLIPLGEYAPLLCELFICQNVVAVRIGALTTVNKKSLGI